MLLNAANNLHGSIAIGHHQYLFLILYVGFGLHTHNLEVGKLGMLAGNLRDGNIYVLVGKDDFFVVGVVNLNSVFGHHFDGLGLNVGLLGGGDVGLDVDYLDAGLAFGLDGCDHYGFAFDVFSGEVEFGGLSGVGVLDFGDFGDGDLLADLGLHLAHQFLDFSFVVI